MCTWADPGFGKGACHKDVWKTIFPVGYRGKAPGGGSWDELPHVIFRKLHYSDVGLSESKTTEYSVNLHKISYDCEERGGFVQNQRTPGSPTDVGSSQYGELQPTSG